MRAAVHALALLALLAAVPAHGFTAAGSSAAPAALAAASPAMRLRGGGAPKGGKITESAELAKMNSVESEIVIDATPEECFAAATGFEDYPKWAGGMKKVNVIKRQGGLGQLVQWTMGILNLVDRPVFKYTYGRGKTEMTWCVNEPSSCIKDLQGRYTFTATSKAAGAPKTRVHYKLYVEPRIPFPAFVKKVINQAVAKQALKELKRYTEKKRVEAVSGATGGKGEAANAPKKSFLAKFLSLFACA